MSIFHRRPRQLPKWELAAAAYDLMLRTCRTCGTVHPTSQASSDCEFSDWEALFEATINLHHDRTLPGHVHRECGRCGEPLTGEERTQHMDAWSLYPPGQVAPALCHMCHEDLADEDPAAQEAEERELAELRATEQEMLADIAELIEQIERGEF